MLSKDDLNIVIEKFKLGDIERIFVAVYAYFIVGYLILFVIYENNFTNHDLSTQVFLAIAISYPIITIPSAITINRRLKGQTPEKGFFYEATAEFSHASYYYSIMFSLFYLVKHLEIINYNGKLDPLVGALIIIIGYFSLTSDKKKEE